MLSIFSILQKVLKSRKYVFANSVKTIAFRPDICIEHKYKVGYCGHFGVSTITLSGTVAEIRSGHSFHDNRVHVTTAISHMPNQQIINKINKKLHLARRLILNVQLQNRLGMIQSRG